MGACRLVSPSLSTCHASPLLDPTIASACSRIFPLVFSRASGLVWSFPGVNVVPLCLVLLVHLPLGVVAEDLDVDKTAQVELLGPSARHFGAGGELDRYCLGWLFAPNTPG